MKSHQGIAEEIHHGVAEEIHHGAPKKVVIGVCPRQSWLIQQAEFTAEYCM